ncbi:unnamed protein product, partial [Allacma fusca]
MRSIEDGSALQDDNVEYDIKINEPAEFDLTGHHELISNSTNSDYMYDFTSDEEVESSLSPELPSLESEVAA